MGTMIKQVFGIPEYGWTVTVYYAIDGYDTRMVMDGLKRLGCSGNDLKRAYGNVMSGAVNTGLTYSNADERMRIDPYGEEAEYLAGYVGQQMFDVAKMFLCDTCRKKRF